jgi:iron complex outermembrane receptor protein
MMKPYSRFIACSSVAAIIACSAPAFAQSSPSTPDAPPPASEAQSGFGDIVVTAQRRAQSAQDVGITINAFSGQQLANLGVTDVADIAEFTPGVASTAAQGGVLKSFSMRGVTMSDFNPHQEGPIAVYLDDVYVSSLMGQSFPSFDTERVEILKGPQGTLFGRNATGGLVNNITKKPTDTFEGYVSGSYGRFQQRRLEGAVGGPLADGIQIRVAGLYYARDGVLKNLAGPDGDYEDTYALRAHLKLEPTERLTVLLSGRLNHTRYAISARNEAASAIALYDTQGRHIDSRLLGPNETAAVIVNGAPVGTRPCAGCDFLGSPAGDYSGRFIYDPLIGGRVGLSQKQNEHKNYNYAQGVTGNIAYDLTDDIVMTSITDYSHFKWRSGANVVGSLVPTLGYDTYTDGIDQFSEELRLNGKSGDLTWVLGGYYLKVKSRNAAVFGDFIGYFGGGSVATPNPAAIGDTLYRFAQRTRSVSLFGQAEWEFAPAWTLTAGGRYIWERKKYDYSISFYSLAADAEFLLATPFNPSTTPLAIQKDRLWSAKLGLNFKPSDDLMLFANVNRGVKAGGFNVPQVPGVPLADFSFKPEVLWAYEAGFKSDLADGLRFNGAIFYYDYKNYQAFQNLGVGNSAILNAKARNYGAEVDIAANPMEGLNLNVGAAYTNALAKDINYSPGLVADRRPAYASKWKLTGLARYQFPIADGIDAALQADGNYTSGYFIQISNYSLLRQKGYALLNLRASLLQPGKGWRLEASVENVADKRYKQGQFDVSEAFGNTNVIFNRGREFQIQASYSW